jgi:hypothetical protein
MRAAALHRAGVVGELSALRAVVSFAVGRSPDGTTRVEVMNELTANF